MERTTENPLVNEAITKLREIEARNGSVIIATKKGEVETGQTFAAVISSLDEDLAQEVWIRVNEEKINIADIDIRSQEGVLSHREEITLFIKAKNDAEGGNFEARDEFLAKNDRLIYQGVFRNLNRGLDIEDLEQEGRIGLMSAYKLFDWKRGFKFSSYAYAWVKQSIKRETDKTGAVIRYPESFLRDSKKLKKVEKILVQILKRSPTTMELAIRLKLDPQKVKHLKEDFRVVDSLDEPTSDESEKTKIENVADGGPGPYEQVEEASQMYFLQELLKRAGLSLREHQVWALYHLSEGIKPLTLEEISTKLGFGYKWAEALEQKATRKIRKQYIKENPEEAKAFGIQLFDSRKN